VSTEPSTTAVEQPTPVPSDTPKRHSAWWRTLLTGIFLFIVGLVLLVVSGNPNLFPTVVMIGSFTVPAAYVAFFYERRHMSRLTFSNTVFSFFWGGVLGVFAATILEPLFISGNGDGIGLGTAFQVGIIEEAVKVLGVLWIARTIRHDSELDGLIIGAAAGMGFASLESTGYAFTAFLESHGSLSAIVAVTLLRGLLSPLGHGTWTAILAGVLFRQSSPRRFHVDRAVIGAYATVVVLHGLWDGLPSFLAAFMTSGLDIFLAQFAVGLAGVIILWARWREAIQTQRAQLAAVPTPVTPVPPDGGQRVGGSDEAA
jgi:protease PrsW